MYWYRFNNIVDCYPSQKTAMSSMGHYHIFDVYELLAVPLKRHFTCKNCPRFKYIQIFDKTQRSKKAK